jgi:uncharacterized membrane protein (DUF2068 family)
MEATATRSLILKLIIFKKVLFALLLLAISLGSAFSWRHYDQVASWVKTYLLEAEIELSQDMLHLLSYATVTHLQWLARISSLYGVLGLVAAGGLWYGKVWGHLLFALLVGTLIPVEVKELIHHPTPTVILFSILNLAIFGYLLATWRSHQATSAHAASGSKP